METWCLLVETGNLGAASGETCDVGAASLASQSQRLAFDPWTLAPLRQVVTRRLACQPKLDAIASSEGWWAL